MQSIIYDSKAVFPSKIVCVGRNYVAHVQELNNDMPEEPVIFIKPNNAIARQPVALSGEVIHYEAEIAFLISAGRLAGIGLGLDLTKRDLQTKLKAKGLPWVLKWIRSGNMPENCSKLRHCGDFSTRNSLSAQTTKCHTPARRVN